MGALDPSLTLWSWDNNNKRLRPIKWFRKIIKRRNITQKMLNNAPKWQFRRSFNCTATSASIVKFQDNCHSNHRSNSNCIFQNIGSKIAKYYSITKLRTGTANSRLEIEELWFVQGFEWRPWNPEGVSVISLKSLANHYEHNKILKNLTGTIKELIKQ